MDKPSPEDVAVMADFLERQDAARSKLEAQPYDGVQGLPPEWVSEPKIEEFRELRNRLIEDDKWTPEQLLDKLNTYGTDEWVWVRRCPAGRQIDAEAFFDDVGFLAHLYYCSSLPPRDGLRELAGEYAAKGFSASMDRKRAADGTNAPWAESKTRCIEWAAEIWARDPEQRIGEVSKTLWDDLLGNRLRAPEKPAQVAAWLRKAAKKGKLEIPPQAQKGGRPRNP